MDAERVMSKKDKIEKYRFFLKDTIRPLTLPELAFLLWATQGVRRSIRDVAMLRTAMPRTGGLRRG